MATISEQEYVTRIAALERQCQVLSAEIDSMQIVVDAARGVANDTRPGLATGAWVNLRHQLAAFDHRHEAAKEQG